MAIKKKDNLPTRLIPNWYMISFLEMYCQDEWEYVITTLKEADIIWGVVQMSNMFFFCSDADSNILKIAIYDCSATIYSMVLIKLDPIHFINPKNNFIVFSYDYEVEEASQQGFIKIPSENMPKRPNLPKDIPSMMETKKNKTVKNTDFEGSVEEIIDKILDKINKLGVEKLTKKEKEYLSKYSNEGK